MNASTVANLLLIAAAVVWILARQIQVARVKPLLLVAAPVVLAYFGIRSLPASFWHESANLGLLAVGVAISIGLGLWRGQTIKVWRDADGTWWRQDRTLVLWVVLIVALLYGIGVAVGHREASGLGAVLVTLALSFPAQNTVTALRMNAAQPLPGGQPAEAAAGRGMAIPPQLAAHDRLRGRRHERIQARRQERRERRETRNWEWRPGRYRQLCPRPGGAASARMHSGARSHPAGDAPLSVRVNDLLR